MALAEEIEAFFAQHIEDNYFDGDASGGMLTAPIPQVKKEMAEICAQAIAERLEQVGTAKTVLTDAVLLSSVLRREGWEPVYRLCLEAKP